MNATKVQVKLYAEEAVEQPIDSYVPLFHRWIQKSVLDEMVYDVASYTHVPQGTGVLLVGHASDYSIDQSEGRPGLLYSRKRDLPKGSGLVPAALGRALRPPDLLASEPMLDAPRAFGPRGVLFRLPDRLKMKNDDASFDALLPAVEAALKELLPEASYTLAREGEPRE